MFTVRALYVALVVFLALPVYAAEGPGDCATISDQGARLDCFDSFFPAPVTSDDAASEPDVSPITERRALEDESEANWFSITPYKPNYILPITHNFSSDFSPYGEFGDFFNDNEIKFQLSLKSRIWPNLWRGSALWIGYTQLSFWQLYADDGASAPFRETNHEPELMWEIPVDFKVFGWDARVATLALNHQSNGQIEPYSRSWNRVTGELALERGRYVTSVKAWTRIEESENDDNPDIEYYMGRMHLGVAYRGDRHTFAIGLKNNLSSPNRSGVEFNWMFPLAQHLKGFVQINSGYGESMIDAENYTNRIGVGISLTDWL